MLSASTLSAAQQQQLRAAGAARTLTFGMSPEPAALHLVEQGSLRLLLAQEGGKEVPLAVLEEGEIICGGPSYVLRATGQAAVRTFSPSEVPGGLEAMLASLPLQIENLACIRQSAVFGCLPEKTARSLAERLKRHEAKKGEMPRTEHEAPRGLQILLRGQARVFQTLPESERRVTVRFLRAGDALSPPGCGVEMLTEGVLLTLSEDETSALSSQYTSFRGIFAQINTPAPAQTARVPLDAAALVPEAAKTTPPDQDAFVDDEGRFQKNHTSCRITHVQQIDEADCGAASLAMVCRYYGKAVSLTRVRELCATATDGTSLHGMCHAATELGLAARALKVSRRNLPVMPLPAIVHWEGNHWVVLYEVTKKHVRVDDPGLGKRKMTREEFDKGWSGYAAIFDYTTAFEKAPEGQGTLRWLMPFIREHYGTLRQVGLLAVVVTALQLLFPVFTQIVVDRVLVGDDPGLLVTVICGMGVALLFSQAANLIQQFLLAFVTVRLDASVLDFLTRQLLALPLRYFQSRRTGDIQRRLDGARQMREFMVQHGVAGLLALISLTGALTLMFIYNPKLGGVYLLTAPLYLTLMIFAVRVLRPLFADIAESEGRYASHQIDAIKGMESVKAAAAEVAFRDTMLNQFLGVSRKLFRANFMAMTYDTALQGIGLLSTACFLWFGANMVMAREITTGTFVAFSSITALASTAILRVLLIWYQSQHIAVLIRRLNDIFESEPEQGRDHSQLAAVPTLEGHAELRGLRFNYGGHAPTDILRGIDLTFTPGKTTAIVGRSGSGKTTLVKLISGLLEPTDGTVFLDRLDLRTLNYRDVRRHVGMVLQENRMFSDTIARNIAFGVHEPDMERVKAVAKLAAAHDFITKLPMGYETKIGESGMGLSGGQMQRIAIARALYPDPAILIFDEATSALDTESERAIQANLGKIMAGRTSIVIAHRLSTVRDADCIVVLEQGAVAEQGTHEELLGRKGLYWHLCSQQMAE
ncbi:MAG: peptidase domain-containing ABC transporter [Verrucomicrobiaceae bacterium]|nr:peptidase domain-containing ABC transporter [Verrucomicrobiaceae bacterium]